jgi:hypothetical protein
MPFISLLALGWPGIANLHPTPMGAVASFVAALAITVLTIWLCGESARQRAEPARAGALARNRRPHTLH